MEHKKKKELRIRSCLTGAIWLAQIGRASCRERV